MRAMWQAWWAEISAETCQAIIDEALKRPGMPGRVSLASIVDPNYRDSEVRFLPRFSHDNADTADWRPAFDCMEHYTRWANNEAFGVNITFFEDLQFTTYRESRKQHFDWHRDTFWENPHQANHRKLTAILQLSDPASYEGGDLELDCNTPPCPESLRKRGTIIVFPAFVFHRVQPVTKGVRHSLVSWAMGPHWQ